MLPQSATGETTPGQAKAPDAVNVGGPIIDSMGYRYSRAIIGGSGGAVMQNYILAVVAVSGTLLGAWLNARLARQTEDRRWERERRAEDRRWEREHLVRYSEERLAAYTHYLSLTDRSYNRLTQYWRMHPEGWESQAGRDEFYGLVTEITEDGFTSTSRVMLLGSTSVHVKVLQLQGILLRPVSKEEFTSEERHDFHREYRDARSEYIYA